MENQDVLILSSNSMTHAQNKAERFMVNYNVPFDMTGKKVALVSATMTKSQPNITDEDAIEIVFPQVKFNPSTSNFKHDLTEFKGEGVESWKGAYGLAKRFNVDNDRYTSKCKTEVRNERVCIDITLKNKDPTIPLFFTFLELKERHDLWEAGPRPTVNPYTVEHKVNEFLTDPVYKVQYEIKGGKEMKFPFVLSRRLEGPLTINDVLYEKMKLSMFTFVTWKVITPQKPSLPEKRISFPIGKGYYATVDALVNQIGTIEGFRTYGAIIKSEGGKIHVGVHKPLDRHFIITFLGNVGKMLGFTRGSHVLKSRNFRTKYVGDFGLPDMTNGSHFFYIYCSLVEGIMVNEKTLPLLCTLNAEVGEYGIQVVHNAVYPMFVKCIGGLQQKIEVFISDEIGTQKDLLMGDTLLTLRIVDINE